MQFNHPHLLGTLPDVRHRSLSYITIRLVLCNLANPTYWGHYRILDIGLSIVSPYVLCCAIISGNTQCTNVLGILINEEAIYIIGNARYNDHTSMSFHCLSILTVIQLVILLTCIMMHNAFNKLSHNRQLYFNVCLKLNAEPGEKIISNKSTLKQLKDRIVYPILQLNCGIT